MEGGYLSPRSPLQVIFLILYIIRNAIYMLASIQLTVNDNARK